MGAAIESVLSQDFDDFELLVIDDNSPDNTASIVESFKDKRIRYLKNDVNLGPQGNWNRCLVEAKGRYFKLLPHDDVLANNCLRLQVEVLDSDRDQSIALVFCSRNIINPQDRVIASRGYPVKASGRLPGIKVISKCIRHGTNLIGEPGAVMFRKDLAEKIGQFDASIPYIVDLDYWFRLLLYGDAYYIDEPLASFRISSGSWSVAIGNKQSVDFIHFIDRCSANELYKLKTTDVHCGRFMARLNNYLRLIFYKLVVFR